jgi:predicted DNA-binding protein with PD1-like motif
MESKLVWQNAGERTYVLVLDAGEEAFAAITAFAAATKLDAASLTAIGAFERATVGWFDLAKKTYKPIEIDSQCEGLSLLGDIAMGDDGKPSLHMHAVLGMSDGTTRGGHFLSGIVRPTLEVTIMETPARLRRRKRPELGLALIDLSQQ